MNLGAMRGSQHLPREYQIMCVDDFYEIDSYCGRTIVSKGNNTKKGCSWQLVSRFTAGRAGGYHLLRFQRAKTKRVKKPQRIQEGFVRGKNNEAIVISPQQDNEFAPSDKISKK